MRTAQSVIPGDVALALRVQILRLVCGQGCVTADFELLPEKGHVGNLVLLSTRYKMNMVWLSFVDHILDSWPSDSFYESLSMPKERR